VSPARASRSSQATERAWGDKPGCADAGPKFESKANFATRAAFFDPVAVAQDACLQRNAKTFEPADKRRSLGTEACQPEFESVPSCSEAKRTPMQPAALRGSRLSETRDTTKGSEELKFESSSLQGRVRRTSQPR